MASMTVGSRTVTKLQPRKGAAFEALVSEAMDIEQALKPMLTVMAFKLTPKTYVRRAMEIARTTPERIANLREEMEGDRPGFDGVRWSYRMFIKFIRTPFFPAPTSELRRLNFLLSADALAQLAALGYTSFELFAAAAQFAAEKHPQDFGTCEDTQAHERRILALTLKRDELYARIGKEYTADDVVIEQPDDEGRARVTFKLSDGKVTVGPTDSAGERLVNFLLTQQTR